jgi:uncharacterized BrkB/YihY/UPF0761 family membrane protein
MLILLQAPAPPDPNFHFLALVMGWIVTILIAAFALAIIYKMVKGDINLMYLVAGADGDASLARFQFLVFTFVIALGLFLIILSSNPPTFPKEISGGILALLGISSGSYVTAKAVDANANKPPAPQVVVAPPPPPPAAAVVVNTTASDQTVNT